MQVGSKQEEYECRRVISVRRYNCICDINLWAFTIVRSSIGKDDFIFFISQANEDIHVWAYLCMYKYV